MYGTGDHTHKYCDVTLRRPLTSAFGDTYRKGAGVIQAGDVEWPYGCDTHRGQWRHLLLQCTTSIARAAHALVNEVLDDGARVGDAERSLQVTLSELRASVQDSVTL